ncbi:Segregation and condensation protein B [Anaerovibrio sp. JC8]|uniref:SMC-Scp complex subunit ScpB n=1 Tax=Anaerovibrio sp. JC8 TaxID=1240085 RepID=UPI000A0D0BA0|nr:SMC-Scp complex subunit ScpB [Anaerovibrio sp. JC8]ORT98930.1 Segregation and condensation protein B [Anaerovibrio sp. JC8]
MFMGELTGALEAVLFASGDPVSAQQLMEIFGIDMENLDELVESLSKSLEERGSGLMVQHVAGGWQLVTRRELFSYVEKLTETKEKKLSAAAMETLSIIAFKQPITKQEIEHIRGVHIEKVLAKLIELELVRELGRKEVLGRPILYGTTENFLKCFGLNELTDLPDLPTVEMDDREIEQLTLLEEAQ